MTDLPIRSRRVYEEVADRIAQLIERSELQRGERLPTERELAKRFSVSRPSVREAIIALETAGLVEVRAGDAAYVTPKRFDEITLPLDALAPGLLEQLEASALFETQLARNAAERGDMASRLRLESVLSGTRQPFSMDVPAPLTWAFHRALIEAGDNAFMASLADQLWRHRAGPAWASHRTRLSAFDSDPVLTADRFRLAEAVVAGKGRDAGAAAGRLHLRMRAILFE